MTSIERVVSTLPGTDRPVVRYRVSLHEGATAAAPQRRADECPVQQPDRRARSWRGAVADVAAVMPATTRRSSLVVAVCVGYVAAMVAAYGMAGAAVVIGLGGTVLITARCFGRRRSG